MKKSYVATSLTLSIAVGVSGFASVPALAKSKDIDYSKEWETPQYIGEKWEPDGEKGDDIVWSYLENYKDQFQIQGDVADHFQIVNEVRNKETDTKHYRLQEVYNGIP
ncbi:peptidase M4 family protein, partial [Mesorhizobium sp. M00.F.Ca.ET.186.01.1.1]